MYSFELESILLLTLSLMRKFLCEMVRRALINKWILWVNYLFCLIFIERCWCVIWWRHLRLRAWVRNSTWILIFLFFLLIEIWRYRSYLFVRWRWNLWWCRIIDRVLFFDYFSRPWLWCLILICIMLRRRHFIVSNRREFRIWFSDRLGVWGWNRRIDRRGRYRIWRWCRSCCFVLGFIVIFFELAMLVLYCVSCTLLLC